MSQYFRFKFNRKTKYHLVTEFTSNLVIKTPYDADAQGFYDSVCDYNGKERERGLPCVEMLDKNNLNFSWTPGGNINEIVDKDPSSLIEKIEELKNFIIKNYSTKKAKEFEFEIYEAVLGKYSFEEELILCENIDADLILQNFIWSNKEMLVVDLEWQTKVLPLDYLLWRSLKSLNYSEITSFFSENNQVIFKNMEDRFIEQTSNVVQLEKFQFGKLSKLSEALNSRRRSADHELHMFQSVVDENNKLRNS